MTPSGPPGSPRAYAAAARDAALARVGHARRWAILGSAGLSAGFAALVSASPPSHASTTTASRATATPSTTPPATPAPTGKGTAREPALPPLADGSALGLQGPSQPPGGGGSGDQSQSQADQQAQAAAAAQQAQAAAAAQQAQQAPSQAAAPQPQAPVSGGS